MSPAWERKDPKYGSPMRSELSWRLIVVAAGMIIAPVDGYLRRRWRGVDFVSRLRNRGFRVLAANLIRL